MDCLLTADSSWYDTTTVSKYRHKFKCVYPVIASDVGGGSWALFQMLLGPIELSAERAAMRRSRWKHEYYSSCPPSTTSPTSRPLLSLPMCLKPHHTLLRDDFPSGYNHSHILQLLYYFFDFTYTHYRWLDSHWRPTQRSHDFRWLGCWLWVCLHL